MSYNVNLQHIVFRTKHSQCTIPQDKKVSMLAFLTSVSNDLGAQVLRINAYKNHVHILVDVPVTMPISEYVRKIKQTSSVKFSYHIAFPQFRGWAKGYGSFSVSVYEKDHIINYIKGQDEHHRVKTFAEELADFFGNDFIARDPYWRAYWED